MMSYPMNLDRNQLKTLITKSKPSEILVLTRNSLEKGSINKIYKEIEKFINSQDDYVITVIKR